MEFSVLLSNNAEKGLKRLPRTDAQRLRAVLDALRSNPFAGDLVKLKGTEYFRRRVGEYRVIFAVDVARHVVGVVDIARRTTTTYR